MNMKYLTTKTQIVEFALGLAMLGTLAFLALCFLVACITKAIDNRVELMLKNQDVSKYQSLKRDAEGINKRFDKLEKMLIANNQKFGETGETVDKIKELLDENETRAGQNDMARGDLFDSIGTTLQKLTDNVSENNKVMDDILEEEEIDYTDYQ